MTDTTPDAAERLAEALEQLDAFAEDFLKADRPFTAAIMRSIAALIRAQAAEIARLTALDTPAPQPDADEREAMVYLIECTLQEHPAQHESAWHRAHYVADALLAAGWTHKREEG